MEQLRQRGMAMLETGLMPTKIARALRVARRTVYNWKARGTGEEAALQKPGPESRLTPRQGQRLLGMLERGAAAHGWRSDLWTGRRIAALIERKWGVRYHFKSIPRLLAGWGWSWQKPARQAAERDEAATRRWRAEAWPRIKKKPGGSGRP